MVRTWAPRAQTPVLRHTLTHDHLSVISAITPDGRLFLRMQEHAFDGAGVIAFLGELQEQITGKLLVIWDGAPIHRSRAVKAYLADGAAARLHLERLPGYAPQLNPDEGVWHYLKHVETGQRVLPGPCASAGRTDGCRAAPTPEARHHQSLLPAGRLSLEL